MSNTYINQLSGLVLDSSIAVHKELGPGLLESVYETCLCYELGLRNIKFEKQKYLPVVYKGVELNTDYRIDILIENQIVIELKAVEILMPIHKAQLITYLKLAEKKLGLLINFNVSKLTDGFHRVINKNLFNSD